MFEQDGIRLGRVGISELVVIAVRIGGISIVVGIKYNKWNYNLQPQWGFR